MGETELVGLPVSEAPDGRQRSTKSCLIQPPTLTGYAPSSSKELAISYYSNVNSLTLFLENNNLSLNLMIFLVKLP